MLEENKVILDLIINGFIALVLLISVIFMSLTIKSNRDLHRQILLNDLIAEERKLRIKLNEYLEKIGKTRSKKRQGETWNDYDTLLFAYYEYLGMVILKKIIKESDVKLYFKPLLVDVYEAFYYDSEIFDEKLGPFRRDYHYLRMLFKRWKMKSLCDNLFRKKS